MIYDVQEKLKPTGLVGISDEQISDHWNLYKGYVNQVNALNKELHEMRENGLGNSLAYADRRRSYGFEYNGLVLHEYYFGNMHKGENDLAAGELYNAIAATWGSYEAWKKDFEAAGKMRGVGWAILYADSTTGYLTNHFIPEHHIGNVAGAQPILVLDVWEHAYMVDHNAGGRGDYIAAFMQNVGWDAAQTRFEAVRSGKVSPRF